MSSSPLKGLEHNEREKRKTIYYVFHNIPEPSDVSSNEQRVLLDTDTVVWLVESDFGLKRHLDPESCSTWSP